MTEAQKPKPKFIPEDVLTFFAQEPFDRCARRYTELTSSEALRSIQYFILRKMIGVRFVYGDTIASDTPIYAVRSKKPLDKAVLKLFAALPIESCKAFYLQQHDCMPRALRSFLLGRMGAKIINERNAKV